MLNLRTFSKYLALIMFAFFLTSCEDNEKENLSNLSYQEQISNFSNEVKAASLLKDSKNVQTDNSEDQMPHWTTLLVIFLVLASLILVVIYSLFDVKHIKGPIFKLSRKKSESPRPRTSKQKPDPDLKEKEPEVQIPSSDINGHIAQQSQNINELKKDLANLLKTIDDMNLTFLTLKDNLDQKDEELSRYKKGYDATIFKSFLLRFTRVDKVIKEYMEGNKIDLVGLKDIQIQMDDALAECEVEMFSPEIGSNFKTSIGAADNPEIKETSNESEDSTIAEVLKPGYRRKLPDKSSEEYQIITEAKVAIYVYKKSQK